MLDYTMKDLLRACIAYNASDLHITVDVPPMFRILGSLKKYPKDPLTPEESKALITSVMSAPQIAQMDKKGEVDFSIAFGAYRFRVNVFSQRSHYAAAFRMINNTIRSFNALGLPDHFRQLCMKTRGLILVTGPTGSGKSTTLAAMIDYINSNRSGHIITIEDPIEYLHSHKKCIVNQREIGQDTQTFGNALRAALRQDPDVIQVGEMRDLETISTALTAAETGHLVLSTLHTNNAANTVDRVVDVFPSHQQAQVRYQLSNVLVAVISQQLLVRQDGSGRVAALEVMLQHPSIASQIREGKTHQIDNSIHTNTDKGMCLMDRSLANLYKAGTISYEEAFSHCINPEDFRRRASE